MHNAPGTVGHPSTIPSDAVTFEVVLTLKIAKEYYLPETPFQTLAEEFGQDIFNYVDDQVGLFRAAGIDVEVGVRSKAIL